MATTLSDSGPAILTYSITVDGAAYVFQQLTHSKTSTEDINRGTTGLFNGSAAVVNQQTASGKIIAITGTQSPTLLVRFTATFRDGVSRIWKITQCDEEYSTSASTTYSVTMTEAASLTA